LALGYADPASSSTTAWELMQDEGAKELPTHECQDARATPVRELDLVRSNQRFGAA